MPGYPPNFGNARAGYISTVIVNVGVVNNSGTVYNIHHPGVWYIIVINIRAVYISLRSAHPVIIGHVVAVTKR